MAGNSRRKGAMRKAGTKKGAVVGSGGQRRRSLEGKGPTPKAADRPNHKAYRKPTAGNNNSGGGRRPERRSDSGPTSELVAGRNPVVECLRADVPATALYVAIGIDADDRVTEAVRIAADRGISVLEVSRPELDRLTHNATHQGISLQIPPYEYAHPDDLLARAQEADEAPLLVALDGVTDPRNLGAVVRSVAAFGGHGVVLPERRSAGMTASAWKTSAGA
ncbi:MAG: RNA methyltransferase, partial [Kibdelosporangium sp.]